MVFLTCDLQLSSREQTEASSARGKKERKNDVLDRVLRHRHAINHITSTQGMYGERAVLTSENQVNLCLTRSSPLKEKRYL